jgi:general secretion pathway protein A
VYRNFYHLKEEPFRLTPDPAFICMTSQHQEALSGLIYSVCTRPGLTVLVGEAGTGKTTLLYSLLYLLEKRRYVTAMCNNPTLTRAEFYDLLMVKLGVDCASSLKSRQWMALQDTLLQYRTAGRPAVLIVDEAQRLSTELLEEVRLLLNLETPREKLLQIIVAGQPELGETLQRPELRQLKQRISCICRLEPLSLEELREYLRHRLTRAGLPEQNLFSEPVIQVIFEYTQGIPRLVNSLCDSALQTGFALQSSRITIPIVREAARDLALSVENTVKQPAWPVSQDHEAAAAHREAAQPEAPAPPPIEEPVPAASDSNGNGNGSVADLRVPLESYVNRQKSLGFFANLMDRWI